MHIIGNAFDDSAAFKSADYVRIRRQVEALPSVVRCKDCKWLVKGDDRLCEDCVCDIAESPVLATDEDFGCIYGERKEREGNE